MDFASVIIIQEKMVNDSNLIELSSRKKEIDVSIIVPTYNTPINAFQRCMNSITNQSYHNIEIIVIDDGSDNERSAEYREICSQDNRTKYIKTCNQGVSSARNTGVNIATGKYVSFSDADDTLEIDFVCQAFSYAQKYCADIVIGQILYEPKAAYNEQFIPSLLFSENPDEALEYMFYMEKFPPFRILGSPCGRLYKTEIAKTIMFDSSIKYFEDQIYNREFICASKRIVLVPEYWYTYYQNNYSAMHRSYKKWNQMESLINYWNKWEDLNDKETDQKRRIRLSKRNMGFYFDAIQEGVLAGEKYSRSKMLYLLNQYAFTNAMKYVKYRDYYRLQNRIKYLFLKTKSTLLVYLYIRMRIKYKNYIKVLSWQF